MRRTKHPKKDVEEALVHAELQGWLVKQGVLGASFIALTTMINAVVVSSASFLYGVPPRTLHTMPPSYAESSITAYGSARRRACERSMPSLY